MKAGGDSTVTVLVAFGANLAIAVAKTVAAQLTGSASMSVAEVVLTVSEPDEAGSALE